MPSREIEEFAQIIVRHMRDTAIQSCDGQVQPHSISPAAKRWRQSGVSPEALYSLIPDIVDEAVFCFLQALDQGLLPIKYVSKGGTEVDLAKEGLGELSGWYAGNGGWREMFSNERRHELANPD